jgi:hypothetical protein
MGTEMQIARATNVCEVRGTAADGDKHFQLCTR